MFKKIPSISKILQDTEATIRRFSLACLVSAIATTIGIIMISLPNSELGIYPNLLMTLILAFPLFVSVTLISEGKSYGKKFKISADLLIIAFLTLYYYLLPENIFNYEGAYLYRYFFWIVGFVLAITFVRFLDKEEKSIIPFWQYNQGLVYNLALTGIYALAFQAGLSVALGSVDTLFELNIDGDRYAEIWTVIVGFFSPMFFLSHLTRDWKKLEKIKDYPRELKLFSQFVLIPLVSLYFIILYAYVIRILLTQEWPKGILAYMILGFSLLGIFTYFVIYPMQKTAGWVRKIGKIFYLVLIPQIGMLFWALWFRISDYGITEKRYIVFVFGWWLLAMALYFLISKRKDIRIIPATIFIITLLISFGPWGAFAISEKSQSNRLKDLLIANDILVDGKIQKQENKENISKEDMREIGATIKYLYNEHGLASVQVFFKENLQEIENQEKEGKYYGYRPYNLPEKIVEDLIGLDYITYWGYDQSNHFSFFVNPDKRLAMELGNYDYAYNLNISNRKFLTIDGVNYSYIFDHSSGVLTIKKDTKAIAQYDIKTKIEELRKTNSIDRIDINPEEMVIEYENENIRFKLYMETLNGQQEDDGEYKFINTSGLLLFSLK